MSMFLGPIHYVMFDKIKTAAGRSRAVIDAFKNRFGVEAEETINATLPDGPVDFGDAKLEELLGDNPIHQFLQELIDRVETVEATLVTALLYRFPEESRELLSDAFRKHGEETAHKVANDGSEAGLQTIANSLGQIYLEGMPCDQVSSFSLKGERSMQVDHTNCLHREKWETVGAPTEIMCELLDEWVLGFARGLNSGAKLERQASISKGADTCTCILKV